MRGQIVKRVQRFWRLRMEQVSIGHRNWGEFYRLFHCKIHFLVGVLVRAKGGV